MTTKVQQTAKHITAIQDRIADLNQRIGALESATAPPAHNLDEAFHLIGVWVTEQRDNGAATIDGAHLDAVREGIRVALSVR